MRGFSWFLKTAALTNGQLLNFTNIANDSQVNEGNKEFGKYFEQLVCMELKAWISYKSPRSRLTFWCTTSGNEVDFCLDDDLAIEVKSTDTVQKCCDF